MVDRFAFPGADWKINPFGNWVRISDFEIVEKRAAEAMANLEACRSVASTLRAENEALRAQLASIRDETLEEAAKRCEALSWHIDMSPDHIRSRRPEDYAAAIRALQTKGQTNG
jgi:hypothetical protein